MSSSKLQKLAIEVLEAYNSTKINQQGWQYSNRSELVKDRVGDSITNHRVPSVNQFIRYLTRYYASAEQRELGRRLKAAYTVLRPFLRYDRYNNRTDAYDLNEFINNADSVVHHWRKFYGNDLRRKLNRVEY